ncbi:hypothetical protein F5877DRAFT_86619 [Lentinula edodes]|nr:hypothetical protein F5877DRAFT_86619 [Lentinula edodes]
MPLVNNDLVYGVVVPPPKGADGKVDPSFMEAAGLAAKKLDEVRPELFKSSRKNFTDEDHRRGQFPVKAQASLLEAVKRARTPALPYSRAIFTSSPGSIISISREAFTIPQSEFSVKLHAKNSVVSPYPGKLMPAPAHRGEFNNGVAAAPRISSSAKSVDSSWMVFNKPSEVTAEYMTLYRLVFCSGQQRRMWVMGIIRMPDGIFYFPRCIHSLTNKRLELSGIQTPSSANNVLPREELNDLA